MKPLSILAGTAGKINDFELTYLFFSSIERIRFNNVVLETEPMLKHNTSAEKIFVKIEHSTNLSLRVNDRFATCISNCVKEGCALALVSDSADETQSMVSIYDRSYLQLSRRTARTKKKETLKL